MLGGPSELNVGRNITSIDSHYGIAINSAGGGDMELHDSTAYGENKDNMDCPPNSPCDHCLDTTGVMLNNDCDSTDGHLDIHEMWFKLPLFKLCRGFAGKGTYYN